MRKIIIALLSMFFGLAYAGDMGNPQKAWHVGAQALYLQPRYTGYNQFGTLSNASLGVAPTQLAFKAVNDSYGLGFRLEGGYYFHSANDLNLNWSHYNTTTNRGRIIVPPGSSFTDSENNGYTSGIISTLRRPTWDAANAELGRMIHLGDYDDLRFHGGVQYARIRTQVSLSEPNVLDSTTYVTQKLSYSGIGPRLGVDLGYHLYRTLTLYANGAAGLLIGPNQFHNTGIGNHNTLELVTGSTTAIIPELEARLGAKYIYRTRQGEFHFDLGWMWNNYFSSQVNNHSTDTHESDFGLQGLFVGLVWKNNIL